MESEQKYSIERAFPLFTQDKYKTAGIEAILDRYDLTPESNQEDAGLAIRSAYDSGKYHEARILFRVYLNVGDLNLIERKTIGMGPSSPFG